MTAVVEKAWDLTVAAVPATAANVKSFIQEIADEVDANVTGWSVVDNDEVGTSGRQILLKPADADVATMKIAIFGGEVPHASNVESSANGAYLYVAVHADHAGDTFDALFNTAQMLTGAGWCPGILSSANLSGVNSMRLVPKGDAIVFAYYDASDSSPVYSQFFGVIGKDPDGEQIMGAHATGGTTMSASQLVTGTVNAFITGDETPVSTGAAGVAWFPAIGAYKTVAREMYESTATRLDKMITRGGRHFIKDLGMIDQDGYFAGYYNQVRIGRNAVLWGDFKDVDNQEYFAVSADLSTPANAFWMKQPDPA